MAKFFPSPFLTGSALAQLVGTLTTDQSKQSKDTDMIRERRSIAAWMPADTPELQRNIVKRAICDVGICEMPPGSNRSGRIDEYNKKSGAPVGSYWCASWAGAVWWEAGSEKLPSGYASCDNFMAWAKRTNRWTDEPGYGYAVLYGKPGDASHIGIVVRLDPILLNVEGNTSFAGFSRNGVAVDLKPVDTRRVLGYASPTPLR